MLSRCLEGVNCKRENDGMPNRSGQGKTCSQLSPFTTENQASRAYRSTELEARARVPSNSVDRREGAYVIRHRNTSKLKVLIRNFSYT